jgi:hypothetical protein
VPLPSAVVAVSVAVTAVGCNAVRAPASLPWQAVGSVQQSIGAGAGKGVEREGGQETTVTVLAIFLFVIGTLLIFIGALIILIGTFLIAVGATLIIMGMALIAVGAFLLIRRLLDRDRTRSHSW